MYPWNSKIECEAKAVIPSQAFTCPLCKNLNLNVARTQSAPISNGNIFQIICNSIYHLPKSFGKIEGNVSASHLIILVEYPADTIATIYQTESGNWLTSGTHSTNP